MRLGRTQYLMRDGREHIIVTGGSSGIGLATARSLAAAGVPVVVLDIAKPAAEIAGVRFVAGDVRESEAIKVALEESHGQVRGLVLCAAKGPLYHDSEEIVQTDYCAQVQNVLTIRHALEEWASVVMLSSTAGLRTQKPDSSLIPLIAEPFEGASNPQVWRGIRGMAQKKAYAVAKWAVIEATPHLGRMLAEQRVRVNCVIPGPTRTAMSELLWRLSPGDWQAIVDEAPSKMENSPEEVAEVIVWLCTKAPRNLFGSSLHVDGGWSLIHGQRRV